MASNVFFSVCSGYDDRDLKTGSPTVTISAGVATFSVAQTDNLMGVGMVVTYTGGTAYISAKNSTSSWDVVTATGGTPSNVTGVSVTSIKHVYASQSSAEAGASSLMGNSNLITIDVQLNIPCYYDDAGDTAVAVWNSYTTGADNILNIYTPNDTDTECNTNQRNETGIWDTSKYSLSSSSAVHPLDFLLTTCHANVTGLQLYSPNTNNDNRALIWVGAQPAISDGAYTITRNILRMTAPLNGTSNRACVIFIGGNATYSNIGHCYNNLLYIDGTVTGSSWGAILGGGGANPSNVLYSYSNTIYNFGEPIRANTGSTMYVYNNAFIGCAKTGFGGSLLVHDYNCSSNDESEANGKITTQTDAELFTSVTGSVETWDFTTPYGSDLRGNGNKSGKDDLGAMYSSDFNHDTDWRPQGPVYDFGAFENEFHPTSFPNQIMLNTQGAI